MLQLFLNIRLLISIVLLHLIRIHCACPTKSGSQIMSNPICLNHLSKLLVWGCAAKHIGSLVCPSWQQVLGVVIQNDPPTVAEICNSSEYPNHTINTANSSHSLPNPEEKGGVQWSLVKMSKDYNTVTKTPMGYSSNTSSTIIPTLSSDSLAWQTNILITHLSCEHVRDELRVSRSC